MTDEEVEELTGYVYPKRQVRWLEENGIEHYVNGRGKVRILRDHHASRKPKPPERTKPDFTKLKRAHG